LLLICCVLRSSPFKHVLSVVEGGEVRRGMGLSGGIFCPPQFSRNQIE
jgi:hypothetical protein